MLFVSSTDCEILLACVVMGSGDGGDRKDG